MSSVIIMTLCSIYTSVCISQPIDDYRIDSSKCPEISQRFNTEQRKNKEDLVYFMTCIPKDEFPEEYFQKKTVSIEQ